MNTTLVAIYIVGYIVAYVAIYILCFRDLVGDGVFHDPYVSDIIVAGIVSALAAVFWPLAVIPVSLGFLAHQVWKVYDK